MAINAINESQRKAAIVVGFSYVFAMITAVFADVCARGSLIVAGDAAETARNIIANEQLWRLGIASYLLCLLTDVALIASLYIILKRVNPNLALFALLMRVIETAIHVDATLNSFDVLRLLSGADYLKPFGTDQLAALARIPVSAYGSGLIVGFVFLGVGSTVFGYLWFKSNYIPKWLAALGIVGSLLLAAGSFAIIIFPKLWEMLGMSYMLPLGGFEVTMGLWLLIKGLQPYQTDGLEEISA